MDTIIFDLDDVLVKDAFFGLLKEFCKTILGREITKEEVGSNYYYEKEIFKDDPESIKKFQDYFLEHDMYEYGIIEEGSQQLLRELCKTHNVVIFTSSILEGVPYRSGILFKNKYDFLCKAFPFIPTENYILGRNKSIIFSKYMVDDRVDNLNGNVEVKMLYSAKHNLDISDVELYKKGIIRVSSMEEIKKIVYADFSNVEMLELVNKYLSYVITYRNITCSEIQFKLNTEGISTLWIKLENESGVYSLEDIKNLEYFESFMKKRLGVNVIHEKN